MKAVADDAGVTLEPVWTPSRSGFSEVESSDLPLGRLARGECDAAASVPGADSLGRLRDQLELSRPYYGAAFELIAAAGGPSSLEALAGRRVGVQLQSFAHLAAQSLRLDWRARPSPGETVALLDSGEVDAALVWGPALATLDRAPQPHGRRRARYAGTSTSRCAGDRRGFPRSIARSNGSRAAARSSAWRATWHPAARAVRDRVGRERARRAPARARGGEAMRRIDARVEVE